MPRQSVTEYLERAREIAAMADKKSGEEKKRWMDIAEAWLKLADEAAVEAGQSGRVNGSPGDHHSKTH